MAIDLCHNELDEEEFPFFGDEPEEKASKKKKGLFGISKKKKRWGGGNDEDLLNNPRIILVVIGGLTHAEIVSLQQLQANNEINSQVFAGGTSIMSSKEFMFQLLKLHSKEVE